VNQVSISLVISLVSETPKGFTIVTKRIPIGISVKSVGKSIGTSQVSQKKILRIQPQMKS